MNTSSGQLYTKEQIEDLNKIIDEETMKIFKPVEHVTPGQLAKMKVRKKDICPCGSGKIFKNCCLSK